MKTKFTNSELCRVFLTQTQSHGQNANNSMYFSGNRLYSYGQHYKLAEIITSKSGEVAVLINNTGYSNTTGKHISLIRMATIHSDLRGFYTENTDTQKVSQFIEQHIEKIRRKTVALKLYIEAIKNKLLAYDQFNEWYGFEVPESATIQAARILTAEPLLN